MNIDMKSQLLSIVGYFNNDFDEHSPLNIDYNNPNIYVQLNTKKHTYIKIIKYVYNILILGIMSWSIFLTLYWGIKYDNFKSFGKNLFQIIIVLQYLYGIKYFKKFKLSSAYNTYFLSFLWISIFIGLSIAITFVVLVKHEFYVNVYSELYSYDNNNGILLLLLFDKSFSYCTFMINTSIFISRMIYHKTKMNNYSKKIEEFSETPMNLINKINTIITEISKIKNDFSVSVVSLNAFFVVFNLFGFPYLYISILTFANGIIHIDQIIDVVLFILIELIFILTSKNIKESRESIYEVISSPFYVNNFVRNGSSHERSRIINNVVNENNEIIVNLHSIAVWNILLDILNNNWKNFDIFGFKLDDSDILHKIFGLIVTFLLTNELAKFIGGF